MFQEVPLSVYVARTAVIFRFRGVRFQFHVYHRVVHLRFLETGEGSIQPIFFIVDRSYRSRTQGSGDTLRVSRQRTCAVELETYLEVIRHLVVIADVQRDFAVLLIFDVALFVGITCTEVETVSVGGTGDADVVVRDKSGLEDFVLPVGIAGPVGEIVFRVAFVSQLFVVQQFEAFCVYHRNLVCDGLEAERAVDVHTGLSFFGFLGGDDDDTVGATHTEDGE